MGPNDYYNDEKFLLFLVGLAGAAAVSALEWNGWKVTLRRLIVGCLCAVHLGTLAVPLFDYLLKPLGLDEWNSLPMGGFLMGVGGMTVLEIFVLALRLKRDKMGEGK